MAAASAADTATAPDVTATTHIAATHCATTYVAAIYASSATHMTGGAATDVTSRRARRWNSAVRDPDWAQTGDRYFHQNS